MKNPLEKLLDAFRNDLRVAIAKEDEKKKDADLQSARVGQLRQAIDRIEEHIEAGNKAERERMAIEQQRALQGVAGGGPHLGQGLPGYGGQR